LAERDTVVPVLKIGVWDNIGNTLLGMRPWDDWDPATQERFLAEDPSARERIVTLEQLFPDYDIELTWLYDPVKSRRGFAAFIDEPSHNLRAVDSVDVLTETIGDLDVFVLHKENLPPQALDTASGLKLLQHLGSDYRGIPMEAARAKGIPTAASPLVNYSAVSEHVWAMLLSSLKRIPETQARMMSGEYMQQWGPFSPKVRILSDMSIGFLGMGEIARPMAKVAQALEMRIMYWDIVRFPDLEAQFGMEFVEWDTLFRESDIVSTQLALNEQTAGIIGAGEFAMMKPNAIFTNSARGKLVDEPALIAALESGQIGGAALEVFFDEPLPLDSPLHDLHKSDPNRIVLSPHSAAQGPWTWVRDSREIWDNVRRLVDGHPLKHLVG
jgi:D-3-phosphoglycerate dehydrogenase